MAIQDYNAALQNAVKSFNVAMRAACAAVSQQMLLTTVSASPSPTATVFTVANIGLIQAGFPIWVTVSGSPVYTTVTSVSGSAITVPNLGAAPSAGANVGQTVTWYPEGAKPAVRNYPHVTAQFLRLGSYNARRQRLMSEVQIDIFTNDQHQADARRIAGNLLVALGISIDNPLQFAEITQTDSESGYNLPLLPMDLILLRGFESLGDPDPSVTHLFSEFQLFHE